MILSILCLALLTNLGNSIYYLAQDASGREKLLEALKAEGTPLGDWLGVPVYHLPAFKNQHFGRTGCPISCKKYKGKIDYTKVKCPVAEKVSYQEHLTLPNHILLEESNIQALLEALKKVQKYQKEM